MVIKKNSSRYKPLYKYLLRLRGSIQNYNKVLKFKKEKWKIFLFHLRQREKNLSLLYKIFDQDTYLVSKYTSLFRRRFKQNLQNKRKLSLFYVGLTEKKLKRQISDSSKKVALSSSNFTIQSYLVEFLERRLDIIILRSHLVLSVRNAQQLISHGHVYVNGVKVTKKNYLVKTGDILTFSSSIYPNLVSYVSRSNL